MANVLKKGDVTKKEGDDYAGEDLCHVRGRFPRVGFLETAKFEAYKLMYGHYPPRAVNYIWESKAPKAPLCPVRTRTATNSSSSRAAHPSSINGSTSNAIYSSTTELAFGEKPPLVSGVAIMTDTDNTGESAIAQYGDIVFKKAIPH